MPVYLDGDREKRATTNRVVAAIESFLGVVLWGPRQHEDDFLLSLGTVSSTVAGEQAGKR